MKNRDDFVMVAGPSSRRYHRGEDQFNHTACGMYPGRTDTRGPLRLHVMTESEACRRGLTSCRVCY